MQLTMSRGVVKGTFSRICRKCFHWIGSEREKIVPRNILKNNSIPSMGTLRGLRATGWSLNPKFVLCLFAFQFKGGDTKFVICQWLYSLPKIFGGFLSGGLFSPNRFVLKGDWSFSAILGVLVDGKVRTIDKNRKCLVLWLLCLVLSRRTFLTSFES